MKIGAWFHDGDGISLASQINEAARCGFNTIRCYNIEYAEEVAPILKQANMSILAGIHVEADGLVNDWRSQIRLEELERYQKLGIPLDAICVGNELREWGDDPHTKKFSARLSFGLANLIDVYRQWLRDHDVKTPLTYAMEAIVLGPDSCFHEWVYPLIDACDVVSINAYPMGWESWFSFGSFEESRRLLKDKRERSLSFTWFELHLRKILEQLEKAGKSLILSETGFPSAVGYRMEGDRTVVPENDCAAYSEAMREFVDLVRRVNAEYDESIQALHFYEWRDNLHHGAIWNDNASPIHTAFGLCERDGRPKMDIRALILHLKAK